MGRTKKNAAAAPEAAQEGQKPQEVSQDVREPEAVPGAAEGPQEAVGPEDEAELCEAVLVEYAVTAEGGLRLRKAPVLDAPVLATLPLGAGVFGDEEPGPDGWHHVRTGRLEGWMMSKHLEALPGPYYGAG